MKEGKSAISRQFSRLVPVPEQGGTGTTDAETKWYWYHSLEHKWYRYRYGTDAVPLFTTTLVSFILTFLSTNSYTNSIGTLVND